MQIGKDRLVGSSFISGIFKITLCGAFFKKEEVLSTVRIDRDKRILERNSTSEEC